MKKNILLGLLLLTSACQAATPTPAPSLFSTVTLPASPTPVPVTETPAPTFTPEPSPTPLPRFFTDEFDASLAGWVILQAGNDAVPEVNAGDGRLTLRMDSPHTWLYALYGAQDYANVRVDASFENGSTGPATVGLVCRYSDEKGWLEFNLSTDGAYSVLYGAWLDTGIADYLPILSGNSEYARSEGPQEIGLSCDGDILWLYVNGKLIRKVDVSRYQAVEGKVGVAASSFEEIPVVVLLDRVTVGEPAAAP